MINTIRTRFRQIINRDRHEFLREASGVIHVGANYGQERKLYAKYGLRVIWIEPNPYAFDKLTGNIAAFPRQRACQYLVTDCDDVEYSFHLANNDGVSSSIFDFKLHRDIWPHITYEKTLLLRSTTLASLLDRELIDVRDYDSLIIDVQGAELLVLAGAVPVLSNFTSVKVEVSDFESYAGGCQLADISSFMAQHGYRERSRRKFAEHAGGGSYYDILYQKAGIAR